MPTRGQRLSLVVAQGFLTAGGDQRYKSGSLDGTTTFRSSMKARADAAFYGRSTGRDAQVFRRAAPIAFAR